ncbi:hypothetical protein D3C71_1568970 [compost metagenome]
MKLPLHIPAEDRGIVTPEVQVHRQMMVNATGGKGFRPDFMERTVKAAGDVPARFFDKELSKRQVARAQARETYLARAKASARWRAATGSALTRHRCDLLSQVEV